MQVSAITDGMCLAAARELAACAPDGGMDPETILPTMDMWEIFPRVAAATGLRAIEEGVARLKLTRDEIYKKAEERIKRAQDQTRCLMENGFIPAPPEE